MTILGGMNPYIAAMVAEKAAKMIVTIALVIGIGIVLIFSYWDMSTRFPAYALNKTMAPAYWTGVASGAGIPLTIMIIYRMWT